MQVVGWFMEWVDSSSVAKRRSSVAKGRRARGLFAFCLVCFCFLSCFSLLSCFLLLSLVCFLLFSAFFCGLLSSFVQHWFLSFLATVAV